MLEVHETTGFGSHSQAISLDAAADYWLEMAWVLDGTESFVIVNIGNEPRDFNNQDQWTSETTNAIRKLRNAQIDHVLMVDGPDWGQDSRNTMQANAQTVLNADSQGDTVLSVHMYQHYPNDAAVRGYLDFYVNNNLPIVVGEFGDSHFADGGLQAVDEDAILAIAQQHQIGWMAWSWSGNASPNTQLDMVRDYDGNQLTGWGNRVINGTNGLRQTSRLAQGIG